jgi:hypothetical protein
MNDNTPFDIEEYIANLDWSDLATDHEKTLVAGNLRRLYAVLRDTAPPLPSKPGEQHG